MTVFVIMYKKEHKKISSPTCAEAGKNDVLNDTILLLPLRAQRQGRRRFSCEEDQTA